MLRRALKIVHGRQRRLRNQEILQESAQGMKATILCSIRRPEYYDRGLPKAQPRFKRRGRGNMLTDKLLQSRTILLCPSSAEPARYFKFIIVVVILIIFAINPVH